MKKVILTLTLWLFTSWVSASGTILIEEKLANGSLAEKQAAIQTLIASNDANVVTLLQALEAGDLYWYKADNCLAIKVNNGFQRSDNKQPINADNNQFKRIGINNAIRQQLKQYQLQIRLNSPLNPVRRAAAQELMGQINSSESADFLVQKLTKEKDSEVRTALSEALAFYKLDSQTASERLYALTQLDKATNPALLVKLSALASRDPDSGVQQKAQHMLNQLDTKKHIYNGIEQIYFGLSMGSILVLAAIGLAITFGVMRVINMAHGELIMIGAYTTFVVQQALPNSPGLALILSIPSAFIVTALLGMIIERCVIRYLYGRPLETLLATFGISLLLQQLVRTLFSPLNRAIITPDWMLGSIQINDFLSLTINRLYILGFSLLVFLLLLFIMKKTTLGLNVRAISMNPLMARSLGVKANWVNALTFGLGSGIAGLAGVALSQITNVGPNLGQSYIIDSFMVVVFGGVGNLWGTLIAGLILGLANKFIEPITGAMLAKIVVLVGLIFFIQKRPQGLFPQRGRSVEG